MKAAIEAQIANLNAQKLQQQERLQNARAEVNGATASLERIEGGLQVCQWMLDEVLTQKEEPTIPIRDGVFEAPTT